MLLLACELEARQLASQRGEGEAHAGLCLCHTFKGQFRSSSQSTPLSPLNECQRVFYLCACDPAHLGSDALHDQTNTVDADVSLVALRRTVGRWVLRVARRGQRCV